MYTEARVQIYAYCKDYKVFMRFLYSAVLACFFVVAPVGAQSPPNPAMLAAQQALADAEREQAAQWAPEPFRNARSAYEQALALQGQRKKNDADRAALRAEAQAVLAVVQTRQQRLAEEVERKISENNALRRNLLIGKDSQQP